MRIKDFFTVPQNEKVTEKHLYRVLISSVCSILLCMSCLAGTTWAWFTVSIENTGNVIQIADLKMDESITHDGAAVSRLENGSYQLHANHTYHVRVTVSGGMENSGLSGDSLAQKYVIMTLVKASGTEIYYKVDSITIETLKTQEDMDVSFAVSWTKPENTNAILLEDVILTVGEGMEEQVKESSVSESEGAGETTEPAEGSSGEETTIPEEEPATTENASEPDEPTTAPQPEETTAPAETTQPATESVE